MPEEKRHMHIHFKDKVVAVTGATTGIGFKIAEGFAREGAKVAICARNEKGVETAVREFEQKGYTVYGEPVDVSVRNRLFSFADNIEAKFGGIDIWVSNAAVCPLGKVIETPEDVWQQVMDVNVKAVYYGGIIAAEKIKKRGGGVLINAASFASLMPSVGYGVYSASKAAVFGLTKVLAAELAPYNIRVVGYIPGMIATRMTKDIIENKEALLEKQAALKRLGECQEVADAVLFAASDRASYITGTFIEVSGGKYCVQNPTAAWES